MVKQRCIEYAIRRQLSPEIELTPPRVKMATFPARTEVVTNPIGTAPGMCADVNGTVLFALPGVPFEMEAIFTETIAPQIKHAVGDKVFWERSMFVDNIVESNLAPLIDQVMSANEGIYIKSHVCTNSQPVPSRIRSHIEAHFTLRAEEKEKPKEKLQKAMQELTSLVEANGGQSILEE